VSEIVFIIPSIEIFEWDTQVYAIWE